MKHLPFSVGSRRIPRALALVTVFATLSAAQAGTAIYISPSTKTMPTGWNGLDMVNGHAPILHKNLVDSEGNATSVGLLVMSPALGPWNNAGTAFTGDAAEFEPGRSAGSGCCAAMCAQGTSGYGLDDQEAFIRARVTGLDPAKLYEFSFVAQRYSSNDDDSARDNQSFDMLVRVTAAADSDWRDRIDADSAADPDGDGYANLREWRKGTDPSDPFSHPPASTILLLQ
ncbi:MAG: hypothetical protein IJK04_16540 [Kiritimatiellae bacterium]|nr:hypothetical protein [Kiritimatiellia bacterium]